MAERTFASAAAFAALPRKLRYDGTAIATRMPRMMMTTRSSIRVKPCSPASRFLIFVIGTFDLLAVSIGTHQVSTEGVRALASNEGIAPTWRGSRSPTVRDVQVRGWDCRYGLCGGDPLNR